LSNWNRGSDITPERPQRINTEITAPEIRVVGTDGEQLGIMQTRDALRLAEEREIDLVEIAPLAKPPVCKLMDFGKFKYREQKKAHEAKLKQKQIQVKEIKFRPGTDEGDYSIKLRNLIKFLEEGDKTKVTLRFRGREMAHQELGMRLIDRVKTDLDPHGVVEQYPKMEGRQLVMVLAPRKVVVPSKKKSDGKPEAKAEAKAEAKPESKPESKPEAKPEAKPAGQSAPAPSPSLASAAQPK
jgi:translation initiation factor IF-3